MTSATAGQAGFAAMPELQVLNGSLQWKTVPVSGARFLIGRKDTCHLVLKDGWVSREHTLIMEPRPGEFRVQDLDSENGTFLNGERIRDIAMKHGDVLRVGRTEMRFTQHPGSTPPDPIPQASLVAESPDAGLRTLTAGQGDPAEHELQTMRVDPLSQTSTDDLARGDGPRIDLRERVRRLEARLLEGEQANAALAAENAVLKRALARLGVLDRATGAVDPSKLTPTPRGLVPDVMLRFVTNPLARISFPGLAAAEHPGLQGNSNPALVDLGLVGIDATGVRFAECVARLGYRRAVAITAEREVMRGGLIDSAWRVYVDRPKAGRTALHPASDNVFVPAMPKIEEVFSEAFGGSQRVLLCADASAPLAADGLTQLSDVVRRSGAQAGAVVFFDPADDHVESHARAANGLAAARTLAEAGRLAPLIIIDLSRAQDLVGQSAVADPVVTMLDSIAGALDAMLRLPIMPATGPSPEPAAVLAQMLAKGWSTFGLAGTRDTSREALEAAFAHALTGGLLAGTMPRSRARAAFICTVVGASMLDAEWESRFDAARAANGRLLPQAQRLEATYHDAGDSVRIIAFVGGLPYPETFLAERSRRP
jgi:hypothetical protein